MNLNRSDIVNRLAKRTRQFGTEDIELVISLILEALTDHLAKGDRVELRGFGSFHISYRCPRRGRNPRSGQGVDVPGKWVPHFKPGKSMRSEVNLRFEAKSLAVRRECWPNVQSLKTALEAIRASGQGIQPQEIAL